MWVPQETWVHMEDHSKPYITIMNRQVLELSRPTRALTDGRCAVPPETIVGSHLDCVAVTAGTYADDVSWMLEEGFKVEAANWLLTPPAHGLNIARLAKRIKWLQGHLLEFRKKIRECTTQRTTVLAKIKGLDDLEEIRKLSVDEAKERRGHKEVISRRGR